MSCPAPLLPAVVYSRPKPLTSTRGMRNFAWSRPSMMAVRTDDPIDHRKSRAPDFRASPHHVTDMQQSDQYTMRSHHCANTCCIYLFSKVSLSEVDLESLMSRLRPTQISHTACCEPPAFRNTIFVPHSFLKTLKNTDQLAGDSDLGFINARYCQYKPIGVSCGSHLLSPFQKPGPRKKVSTFRV